MEAGTGRTAKCDDHLESSEVRMFWLFFMAESSLAAGPRGRRASALVSASVSVDLF